MVYGVFGFVIACHIVFWRLARNWHCLHCALLRSSGLLLAIRAQGIRIAAQSRFAAALANRLCRGYCVLHSKLEQHLGRLANRFDLDHWKHSIGGHVSQEIGARNDSELAIYQVKEELMQPEQVKILGGLRECLPGLVSVVIPTYNQVEFVRETFDSVLAQNYPRIEIIITDDGSVDGTSDVIKEYAARYPGKIVPVLSDKNTGIAANFNRGLNKVRGEYIAWLGGDDMMFPEKIGKQVGLLQQRSDAVGCCHDAEVFESPSGRVLGTFSLLMNGKPGFKEGGVELWFDASYFMLPSTVMVRSESVPAHGFDVRLKYANDWLLDIEIFRHGKCVVLNEVLGRYRRHANNVTGDTRARKQGNEDGMIALCIVDARYPELHALVKKRRAVFFLAAATSAFRDGDSKKFRDYLKVAISQGALVRSIALFVGLPIVGAYVIKQTALLPYQRSPLFMKLSKYIKG